MNKKNLSVIGLISLLVCNIALFQVFLNKKLNLVEVPITSKEIAPRTKISEDMITFKQVPAVSILEGVVTDKQKILNKLTEIEGIIPKNSFFYERMLFEEKDLPDYPALKLKENQNVFSLSTDLIKSSGNTLTNNQRVDLHVTIEPKKEPVVTDLLLAGVRVLNVKDRKGNDMNDSSSKVPYVINLAINQEYVQLLKVAKEIGTIDLYATAFPSDQECVLNEDSKVLELLNDE